jgi:DNA-binding transcriptional MerR regulator
MRTYRVSQLVERSGVPATTPRFYETAGLLPAGRTAAGYRVYREDAVDRLAFIASAKSLGLPLEEIRDPLAVRERGVCAAVRERLLPLVADRIADADRRRAELAAFAARLAEVHDRLAGPAPAGACGPRCGCTTGPAEAAEAAEEEPEAWRRAPVVCTLATGRLGERTERWRALVARAADRDEIPDGLRLTFLAGPELAAELAALAAAEQDCCAFFDFTLRMTPNALDLTIRAPREALPLLADLFGAPA